jgi:hypothetical protein
MAPLRNGSRIGSVDMKYRWTLICLGYGGQYLFVVPEHDLIAVFTGWNVYDTPPLDVDFALGSVLEAVNDAAQP